MTESTGKELTPLGLYHGAWTYVMNGFINEKQLARVSDLEHRFDDRIVTFRDAVHYTKRMLSTLNERYTMLMEPQRIAAGASTTRSAPAVDPPGARPDVEPVERAPDVAPESPFDEHVSNAASSRMLDGKVGYLRWTSFNGVDTASQVAEAMSAILHAEAFIVDLRGNLGGRIWNVGVLLSMFLDEGEAWSLLKRDVRKGYSRTVLTITPEHLEQVTTYDDGHPVEKGIWNRLPNVSGKKPVVLLLDERSASATEIFAAILRDYKRVFIVGKRSRGKCIAQATLELGGGYKLQVTDGYAFPPSGYFLGDAGQTVANGLVPDLEASRGFRDGQLQAALNHLYGRPQKVEPAVRGGGSLLLIAGAIGLALLAGGRQARA